MTSLNLGILAHIDAGKTSLTERLLLTAGVTDRLGSVDAGDTQTDSLDLERARGITIKSAVVSFELPHAPGPPVTVNLVDTPGHPDFIAEVDRVLGLLDAVVLVVSAVEGVQAQTRVLARALRRLSIPTLVFANKIDRRGAREESLLAEIAARLDIAVLPLNHVTDLGTRAATVRPAEITTQVAIDRLTEHDDALLADWLEDPRAVTPERARRSLRRQVATGLIHPVVFGSAITGAGTADLVEAVVDLLPTGTGDPAAEPRGEIFKIDRGPAGERVAYVRVADGTLRVRESVTVDGGVDAAKITRIAVFERGSAVGRDQAPAGRIAQVWGLGEVRVGSVLGRGAPPVHAFSPPTLETVVRPTDPADRGRLFTALTWLAEQDPLIGLRHDHDRHELSVMLYGEVQKEVIGATLADELGLPVTFDETTTVCVERVVGTGSSTEMIKKGDNPFLAGIGLRVEPAAAGTGVTYELEVELGAMPYAFMVAIEETVRSTLRQGLHGWDVPDARVILTHTRYYPRQSHSHATFDKAMSSTGADFRLLTPLVLLDALRRAATEVRQPMVVATVEAPADAVTALLPTLARLDAVPLQTDVDERHCVVAARLPADRVHALTQALPGLTRGEGTLETQFDGYAPTTGPVPSRRRIGLDPLDRTSYLLRTKSRSPVGSSTT